MTGPQLAPQRVPDGFRWLQLAHPEGNEFCVGRAPKPDFQTAARRAHHPDATDPVGWLAGEQCADRAAQQRGGATKP
jgi:hypothetical protein